MQYLNQYKETVQKNIEREPYNKNNTYYSVGMKAYKEKRWQDAIKYLEKSILEEGEYYRAVFIIGKCYSRLRDNKIAEEKYRRVIELNEKDIHARTELGRLYVRQGKEEAEEIFNEVIKIGGKAKESIPARTELGRLYARQGKEEAEEIFNEIMEFDANNIHARTELGRLYARQGKEEAAEKLFKEAIELDAKGIPARTELGRLYVRQGRGEVAEKLFKEAIEIGEKAKESIPARTELGRLYVRQGREEEAEKLFNEVIKIGGKTKESIPARTELGRLYVKQGREEAEKLFNEIIEMGGKARENIPARIELGKLYVRQGKEKAAEKLFKEATELDEKSIHARTELGRLYVMQGKEEAAEKLFKEAIELEEKSINVRTELGRLYARQGKEEVAEKLFKEIIELDEKDIIAQEELEKLHTIQESRESDKEILNNDIEIPKEKLDMLAIIRAKVRQNKITQEDITKLKEESVKKSGEEKNKYCLAIIASYEKIGQNQQAIYFIKQMKKEGINARNLNAIEQRLKSKRKCIFDMEKWDNEIGWTVGNVNLVEIEENEENAINIEEVPEIKIEEHVPIKKKAKKREVEVTESVEQEQNSVKTNTILPETAKSTKNNRGKKKVNKKEQPKTTKIYQVLPVGVIDTIGEIRKRYYAKMQNISTQNKYVKRYNALEELLLKDSENKRAKAEIMLIMINEGYKNVVQDIYPKEYEFINTLIIQYKTQQLDAKTVQQKIDEYCI